MWREESPRGRALLLCVTEWVSGDECGEAGVSAALFTHPLAGLSGASSASGALPAAGTHEALGLGRREAGGK